MGYALTALGMRTHNSEPLKDALFRYQQAGPVFRAADMGNLSEYCNSRIIRLQEELRTESNEWLSPRLI
jgi:hypothetical protein